jgi:hypothetical protein
VASLLNAFRKDGVNFVWGEDQEVTFNKLKAAILQPPILCITDFSRSFILQTDTSEVALGSVLPQEFDECCQPITYVFHTLSAQE